MRVLVVEDNSKTASFVSKALKAEGFAVDVLRDGENQLTVRSLSDDANFNRPPFFMLDAAEIEREPGNDN